MTATPLSDVMSEHAESGSGESYDRFVALFRKSVVGIAMEGVPGQSGGSLGARMTTRGDGRKRILAYADPETFLVNFGPRFNAGVEGEVLLGMVASDPECAGVLVNSATREISLVIADQASQN